MVMLHRMGVMCLAPDLLPERPSPRELSQFGKREPQTWYRDTSLPRYLTSFTFLPHSH